jgi:mannose-6-phosphate isomerase-like protein (cupin superfamily)
MKGVRQLKNVNEEPRSYGISYTLFEDQNQKVGLNIVRPGGSHPEGSHDNGAEFFYILEGSGVVNLDQKRYEIRADSFVEIPKNTLHSLENTGDTPLKFLYCFCQSK